jgi:hypothetical protein
MIPVSIHLLLPCNQLSNFLVYLYARVNEKQTGEHCQFEQLLTKPSSSQADIIVKAKKKKKTGEHYQIHLCTDSMLSLQADLWI